MELNGPTRGGRPINVGAVPADSNGMHGKPANLPNSRVTMTKSMRTGIAVFLGVVVLGLAGWFAYNFLTYAGIDTGKYQAVYLVDKNVYFGKVRLLPSGYVMLTDVFRVEAGNSSADTVAADGSDNTATSQASAPDIKLIKPGNELHAPYDVMIINRDQVLFIENLKTDGKVSDTILKYHREKDDK